MQYGYPCLLSADLSSADPKVDPSYQDPGCLSDCDDYPSCFKLLMEDYTENAGVCNISVGFFANQWPASSTPCTGQFIAAFPFYEISEGLCRPETETAFLQQQCNTDIYSLQQDVSANIRLMVASMCRSEIVDNFDFRPSPPCSKDCTNILTESGTAVYQDPLDCLSDCPTTMMLNTRSISSPNFPENYPIGAYLYYVLEAPKGRKIDILFKYFDIRFEQRCTNDWVVILDSDGSDLLQRSCGDTIPAPITSRTNQATLVFFSNTFSTRQGFQADLSDDVTLILINVTDSRSMEPASKIPISRNPQELKQISMFDATKENFRPGTELKLNPLQTVDTWGITRRPVYDHTRGRYPWICSLRSKQNNQHYCGTTILSRPPGPLVMVTAAHCVFLCKSQEGNTRPNCCCENVSETSCSADSGIDCGTNPRVEVMTGEDTEVICGEWETGNYTAEESGEEFNIILDVKEIKVHPDYEITRGINNSQFVMADIATIKLNEDLSDGEISRLTPVCLPQSKDTEAPYAVHAGWSSPPPLEYIQEQLPLHESLFRDFFKLWHYKMSIETCLDPIQYYDDPFGPTGTNITYLTNSYYPPGTICAREVQSRFCPTSGESGSPLMVQDEEGRYEAIGLNSFIKGCSVFFIRGVQGQYYNSSKLDQYSGNPVVHTRLSCYLPWVAEQYGLIYTQTGEDVRCEEGTGDINEVGGDQCRTTPSYSLDRIDRIEALCIFPFYLDGIEYNQCILSEIQDFTRPRFACPIREDNKIFSNLKKPSLRSK